MIDLEQGWRTERLDLEPLVVTHAAELAPLLHDARPHEFTGWGAAERRRGYAREAARSLAGFLRESGRTVVAHIHPGHLASQRVARATGLAPTGEVRDDGEMRWAHPA